MRMTMLDEQKKLCKDATTKYEWFCRFPLVCIIQTTVLFPRIMKNHFSSMPLFLGTSFVF